MKKNIVAIAISAAFCPLAIQAGAMGDAVMGETGKFLLIEAGADYYNAIYNDDTEQYECKEPPEFGTTNRVVGLNDLAGSIKTQYDQSLIPPYPVIPLGSPGNPFTHTITDS